MSTVDRVFSKIREHKLELTIGVRLKQVDESPDNEASKQKKK
jgi:hypothetical protein